MHKKMYLCRAKHGLGGHDVYAQERNAREILEYRGKSNQIIPHPKNLQEAKAAAYSDGVNTVTAQARPAMSLAMKQKRKSGYMAGWDAYGIAVSKARWWLQSRRSKVAAANEVEPATQASLEPRVAWGPPAGAVGSVASTSVAQAGSVGHN